MTRLVAFDLDGVLYSAEPFLGAAYREAIGNVNARRAGSFARVPSTREILDHVGWPVPVILQRLFPTIDPVAVDLLHGETLPVICRRVHRREGHLFANVPATLAALRHAGYTLAVASNGRRRYVESVLQAHAIGTYFSEPICVDQGSGRLEKADLLRAYLQRHQITAARLIMVGDRASDVEAAAAVGCAFIGCDYGHGHRGEIERAGPVVSAFDQLPAQIGALFASTARPASVAR